MSNDVSPAAQGEFRGDFTRDTFNPLRHFSRVLMQQGRVQLDADWNEQASILLHLLRSLAADLVGPYAGSVGAFKIGAPVSETVENRTRTTFPIAEGHYYVDGILVEQEGASAYYTQPHFQPDDQLAADRLPDPAYLVYLDVWERHVTDWQYPEVREVALRGPDTATRAQVVWQVRWLKPTQALPDVKTLKTDAGWAKFEAEQLQVGPLGLLQAKARTDDPATPDPCLVPPDAQYTGPENQLYRVEIHSVILQANDQPPQVTVKWSRDNSSLAFAVQKVIPDPQEKKEADFWLESLGRDDRSMLEVDDWVEIVAMGRQLSGEAGQMARVTGVDIDTPAVTLRSTADLTVSGGAQYALRRWDHRGDDEAIAIAFDSAGKGVPIPLEYGIVVTPQVPQTAKSFIARPGDYWLIPARTETGDIEWPTATAADGTVDRAFIPPHGVQHHYAPLAVVGATAAGGAASVADLRREITPSKLYTQL